MSGRVSESTAKRLFALSGNRCAFPRCAAPLVDPPSGTVLGRICHIKARSPNGPRYDPAQSDADRNGFENLLILCTIHHEIIDADEEAYTVERLLRLKHSHEERWRNDPLELSDELAHALLNLSVAVAAAGSVIAVQHQSGGQTAHAITNVFASGTANSSSDAIAVHDSRIFREADAHFGEESADKLFNNLLAGHNYYLHQSDAIQAFISFLEKVSNEFLDTDLEASSDEVITSLSDLLTFIALNFWIWPESQERENLRFCMYPWGNMDRGWDGSAEAQARYARLEKKLYKLVNVASAAFVSYRRKVKQRLYI